MPGIFVCYRREDSAGHAGRLFDRLREKFGQGRVFMDVEGIEPGVDFAEVIERAVGSCDVLLAMIGKDWLTCVDDRGRRRLDDPHDFIRLEIGAALARNVRVIPVLVEGARMPAANLPDELKALPRRQAVELRDSRWNADVQDLIALLERTAGASGLAASAPPDLRSAEVEGEGKRGRSGSFWAVVGISLLIIAALALVLVGTVEVPNVVGEARDVAVKRLRDSGLEVGEETRQPASGSSADRVLRQSTAPGTRVARRTRIGLVLATSATRKVPDVSGQQLLQAQEALVNAGFLIGSVHDEESTSAPPGSVLRQDPPPGREVTEDAARVSLVIANSPTESKVSVPAVVGLKVDRAVESLKQAGLLPEVRPATPDARVPTDQVVEQNPPATTQVDKGTRVNLLFNPRITVKVPDLVGMPWTRVLQVLTETGIRAGRVTRIPDAKAAPETVLSQSPPPGTDMSRDGATVDLQVATAEKPPEARYTIAVYFTGAASEAVARGLADYLRTLRGVDAGVRPGRTATGRFRYYFSQDARSADAIAQRCRDWLARNGRRDVTLETESADPDRAGAKPGWMEVWIPPAEERPDRVRVKQTLRIPATDTADLDAGRVGAGKDADLWFQVERESYLSPMNGASLASLRVRNPGVKDCAGAKYGLARIPLTKLGSGLGLCVHTNGGRYSFIVVRPVFPAGKRSPEAIEVNLITWEVP